jgi:hypothetical protein
MTPLGRLSTLSATALIAATLLVALASPLRAGEPVGRESNAGSAWRFKVFLDDREIGYHHFFLAQASLLNTQNGKFRDVVISQPVFEELEVQGEQRPSYRYRLATGALDLDLWYSTDLAWPALETEVKGGRPLSYELM